MRYSIPAIFFEFSYAILARYLQNQSIVRPPMLIALCGDIISIILNYLFIYVLGYGYLYERF